MAVCGLAFLTGLLGMARKLLYTPLTWALAIATFVALFWLPQIVPLLIAAGLGAAFLRRRARCILRTARWAHRELVGDTA